MMEVDEAVKDGRWREGEGGLVVVDEGRGELVPVVIVGLDDLVELLDVVTAQGGVTFDGKPAQRTPSRTQFHSHTIRVLDIRRQRLADIALGTRLHELVTISHVVGIDTCIECRSAVHITQFQVVQPFCFGGRVGSVVGEVVAFGFTMADGIAEVCAVAVLMERKSCFRVQEVVFLVDVETLIGIGSVGIGIELVVDTIGEIAYMSELDIAKDVKPVGDVEGSLCICTHVALLGIAVVVFQFSLFCRPTVAELRWLISDDRGHRRVGVGEVAEVVALEVLDRCTAKHVPAVVCIVHVPHHPVGVLAQSFLADEVAPLHSLAIRINIVGKSELLQFVLVAELVVVSISVGIVYGGVGAPVVVDLPGKREDVVVLPEVVGRLVPQRTVAHLIAADVPTSVPIGFEVFVQAVEASHPGIPQVIVGLDAVVGIHAVIVVAGGYTVPCLSRLLVVAEVLVAHHEVAV